MQVDEEHRARRIAIHQQMQKIYTEVTAFRYNRNTMKDGTAGKIPNILSVFTKLMEEDIELSKKEQQEDAEELQENEK